MTVKLFIKIRHLAYNVHHCPIAFCASSFPTRRSQSRFSSHRGTKSNILVHRLMDRAILPFKLNPLQPPQSGRHAERHPLNYREEILFSWTLSWELFRWDKEPHTFPYETWISTSEGKSVYNADVALYLNRTACSRCNLFLNKQEGKCFVSCSLGSNDSFSYSCRQLNEILPCPRIVRLVPCVLLKRRTGSRSSRASACGAPLPPHWPVWSGSWRAFSWERGGSLHNTSGRSTGRPERDRDRRWWISSWWHVLPERYPSVPRR